MRLPTTRLRIWILALLLLVVMCVFTAQLMQIQIVDAAMYRRMLDGRRISTQQIRAVRGEIVDRNGVPLVVNEMGYDIIFDYAFLPRDKRNETILRLITMFEMLNEEWIDNLPISKTAPFSFESGYEAEIDRLKVMLKTQPYANADEVIYWLTERYGLGDFSANDARKIAAVRYEMERRDFSNRIPYVFSAGIDISSVIAIKEHSYELPGVNVRESAIRVYENGDVAPHIIGMSGLLYKEEYSELKEQGKIFNANAEQYDTRGYTMDDIIGKDGIEGALEYELRGHNGLREISFDSGGDVVDAVERIPPIPGNTVMLTIDAELQRLAYDALVSQIKYLNENTQEGQGKEASYGAVSVVNCKTGEVLALATYPSYDLANYRADYSSLVQQEGTPLFNRAVMGQYTPGSIYKSVVGLAGINSGLITPQSLVRCGRIYNVSQGHSFTCMSAHGAINVVSALSSSCNIFFYDTGRRAGIETVDNMAAMLGLGEPTGIEISEALGQRSNPEVKMAQIGEPWYEGDVLQSSIGQLFNRFTPIQLANYAATIGNRGKRMELTLVHEIRDYSMENVVRTFEPAIAYDMNEDVPPEMFDSIVAGMVSASRVGTARGTFANYPVDVASKTGTPQVTVNELNSTFICFAPAQEPEIAISVVIERGYHGYTGAPVAKAIFDTWFGYEDVIAWSDSGPRRDQLARLEEKRLAEAAEQSTAEVEEQS